MKTRASRGERSSVDTARATLEPVDQAWGAFDATVRRQAALVRTLVDETERPYSLRAVGTSLPEQVDEEVVRLRKLLDDRAGPRDTSELTPRDAESAPPSLRAGLPEGSVDSSAARP